MGKVLITEQYLRNIAEAIRDKLGTTNVYKPSQMAEAIRGIPTGGAGTLYTVNFPTTANQTISLKCDDDFKSSTFRAEKGSTLSNLIVIPNDGYNAGKASITGGIKEFVEGGYCLLGDAIISVTDAIEIPSSNWVELSSKIISLWTSDGKVEYGSRQGSLKSTVGIDTTQYTELMTEVEIYTEKQFAFSGNNIEIACQSKNHNQASWGMDGTDFESQYAGANNEATCINFIDWCSNGINGSALETAKRKHTVGDEDVNAFRLCFRFTEPISGINYAQWIDGNDTNIVIPFFGGFKALLDAGKIYFVVFRLYVK